jgi:hypothetical protein
VERAQPGQGEASDPIRSYLTTLPEKSLGVLSVAAVVGREFSIATISAVSARPIDQVGSVLDEAVLAGLITEVSRRLGIYRFSDERFHERIYEDLSATRRQWLHRQVAEALERIHATDLTPQIAHLAQHYFAAGDESSAEKAAEYSRQAGEAAEARSAWVDAAAHYKRAFQALALLRTTLLTVAFLFVTVAHAEIEPHRRADPSLQRADSRRELAPESFDNGERRGITVEIGATRDGSPEVGSTWGGMGCLTAAWSPPAASGRSMRGPSWQRRGDSSPRTHAEKETRRCTQFH